MHAPNFVVSDQFMLWHNQFSICYQFENTVRAWKDWRYGMRGSNIPDRTLCLILCISAWLPCCTFCSIMASSFVSTLTELDAVASEAASFLSPDGCTAALLNVWVGTPPAILYRYCQVVI